jgi:hypothetical protein
LRDALGVCTELHPVYRRLLTLTLDKVEVIERHIHQLDEELAQLLRGHQDAVERLAAVPGLELSPRTSPTTSALSRDTISVQATGAGSQKPRVGGGGRASIVGQRFPVVHASTLASVFTTSATVLPTKHLFGHDGP